jgi:putative ABC transport system permease protein
MNALARSNPAEAGTGRPDNGGMAARRAVVRWAWRLFKREWRQQLLVLALILVAVAATVVGATVATDSPAPAASGFGSAQFLATLSGSDPHLAGEIATFEHKFGPADVIENETLSISGTLETYQLRAQNPRGPYGQSMLALVSGRYPTGPGQVAVTAGVASAFNLAIGDTWHVNGSVLRVVGTVENPQSLLDEFALVAPGQVKSPTQVTVLFDSRRALPRSLAKFVESRSSAPAANSAFNPVTISAAGVTVGMLLIALMAVGGFTVLAQRRLRALGMLASIGARPRDVGLVVRANGAVVGVAGAVLGVLVGFLLWLAYRPHLEASSHHLIGVFAVPWDVVALAAVLAVIATYLAASRPARSIARVPIVSALSGRPAPPRQIHRSAIPGIVCFVIAFLLLGYAGGGSGAKPRTPELVLGLLVLIPGVVLLSPFFLSALARLGRRAPIAIRLALRDLARYRARSGSALGAISIGVLIAVIIVIVANVRYSNTLDYAGPNLASNQLIAWTPSGQGGGPGTQPATTASMATMERGAHHIAAALGAATVVPLETTNANINVTDARNGRNWNGAIYVGTPSLLRAFGISPSEVNPEADILTMRPGIAGRTDLQLNWSVGPTKQQTITPNSPRPHNRSGGHVGANQPPPCILKSGCLAHPVVQQLGALPSGTSAPNTVITEYAVHRYGLQSPTSGWLIQASQPFSAAQLTSARLAAAAAGLSVETKNDQPTSAEVIDWATVFGIALALAILAMSLGLLRSETARDLRTLAATGAGGPTRRTLTAATAGAMALLGAVLGTLGGYVGVIGYIRSNALNGGVSALGSVPVTNLLVILLGMPLVAVVIGFLLAGREPRAIGHQPIE